MLKTPFGKLLLAIAIVAFALLQFRFWFGEAGYVKVRELKEMIAAQERENKLMAERNRVLAAEVKDLREGLEAVEEHARLDLGMIKKGETFYLVTGNPDLKKPDAPTQTPDASTQAQN